MRIEKKWTVKNVPNRLSDNQMKHVVAGNSYGDDDDYGGTPCCSYKCWMTLECFKENTLNMSQDDCWDVMDSMCDYGFSIQAC